MADFTTRPLDPGTWPDFERLVRCNSGVWGGCWCMGFHPKGPSWGISAEGNRAEKAALVQSGRARAALVYDKEDCLGWCQFGAPADLPRIKHRKAHAAGGEPLADWRITCLFVDKAQRGRGVAAAALAGALDQIAAAGGGMVESFPEDVAGRKVSSSFLYNSSAEMFEAAGFARIRPLGRSHWLMRRRVEAG